MAKITTTYILILIERFCYKKMTMCKMDSLTINIFFKMVQCVGQKVSQGILMCIIKALALTIQMLLISLVFKSRQDSKVKVTGQNCWFPWNGFVTIYIHVKYQSSSSHCSKVQGHKVKNFSTPKKCSH